MSLQSKLEQYIEAPDVPENSFEIGWEYELIGQYASAMGYYLKCAELTENDLLAYESICRKAICFTKIGGRDTHAKSNANLAIGIMPDRPEAYHILACALERIGAWHESYAISRAAQKLNANRESLVYNLDDRCLEYPGYFALPFQEAVALWWIGRFKDSVAKFKEVKELTGIDKDYVGHCQWNIDNLEGRDADEIAGIKKNTKGKITTNKDEVIKKILAEKKK